MHCGAAGVQDADFFARCRRGEPAIQTPRTHRRRQIVALIVREQNHDGPALLFAHAAVQLYGVGLIAQSVRGIDPLELAGIRRESARGPLQIRGPYALVRHPLYFGWVLAVFGAAHMTGDRLAFAAITTLYLVIAIPWEERSLVRCFGEDFARLVAEVAVEGNRIAVQGSLRLNRHVDAATGQVQAYPFVKVIAPYGNVSVV